AAHPPECRECKWLTLCQGGCQKHRLITHESVTSPTYFCESYKRFFQHSRRRLRRMAEEITARRQGQTGKSGQVRRQTMKTTPKAARARIEEIGRNDACPCGSGRKYKHCCLGKKTSKAR
ncbi:MAG: SEC-C metal-binding domain-containing protein, partial [Candidatus Zipacnadales bacterium]